MPNKKQGTGKGSALVYLKALGIVGAIFGFAAMILTLFFWPAMFLIYSACILCLIDIYFEPRLARWWKAVLAFAIVVAAASFTYAIVLFPAELKTTSYWVRSDYPEGSNIEGITWGPGMSELRVSFQNMSNRDYDNVDVSILTDEGVVAAKQTTDPQCTQISEKVFDVHDNMGNVFHRLMLFGPQRFRCDKLPSKATIQFLFAIATSGDPTKAPPGESVPYVMFGPKLKPKWLKVTGRYQVSFRPHSVNLNVPIDGG